MVLHWGSLKDNPTPYDSLEEFVPRKLLDAQIEGICATPRDRAVAHRGLAGGIAGGAAGLGAGYMPMMRYVLRLVQVAVVQ